MHRHSPKTHPRPDPRLSPRLFILFSPSRQQSTRGGAGAGSSSGGVAEGPVSPRSHARGRVSPRSHGAVPHGHSTAPGARQAPGSPPSLQEHLHPGSPLCPQEQPRPGSPSSPQEHPHSGTRRSRMNTRIPSAPYRQKQRLHPSLPRALPSSPAGTETPTFGGGRETSPHRLLLPLGRGRHWARPAPGGGGRNPPHPTGPARAERGPTPRQLTARSGGSSGVSSGRRAPRRPLHGQRPLRLPSGAAAGTGSSAGREGGTEEETERVQEPSGEGRRSCGGWRPSPALRSDGTQHCGRSRCASEPRLTTTAAARAGPRGAGRGQRSPARSRACAARREGTGREGRPRAERSRGGGQWRRRGSGSGWGV